MKVLNEFPGHHYFDCYEKSDFHCVKCGEREVWEEQGDGDFEVGPRYICTHCGLEFYCPSQTNARPQIIQQLKEGVTAEATTPRGH